MKSHLTIILVICSLVFLYGCGGGGGGGGSNPAATDTAGGIIKGKLTGSGDLTGIPVYLISAEANILPTSIRATILGNTGDQSSVTHTNSIGEFTFNNVSNGIYNIIANKDLYTGVIQQNITVNTALKSTIDFILQLATNGSLSGTVQTPADYQNRAGIIVFIPGTSYAAFTDDQGKFDITGVPVGTYTVAYMGTGLKQEKVSQVQVRSGAKTEMPAISLVRDLSAVAGIIWKGSLPTAPENPQVNWAYMNTTDGHSYLWDGDSWVTFGTADVFAPLISNVTISNIGVRTASLTWATNEPTSCIVEYGLTTNYGSSTYWDASWNNHSADISKLTSGRLYHCRIKAKDSSGNEGVSADFTFSTLAPTANVFNIPESYTYASSTDITVGGDEVVAYKYELDSNGYSDEIPISNSLVLNGLSMGRHSLKFIGKSSDGMWQVTTTPTTVSWFIMESYSFVAKWGSEGVGNGDLDGPYGIAFDSSNNIYVSEFNNKRIQKFNSAGSYILKWNTSGIPLGVAVDSNNNVYVVESSCRVEKFDSNGVYITGWGASGSGNGEFNDPRGIAIDASGNVYVTDLGNQRVQKFDSNGTFILKWGSQGSGDGQFFNPYDVAIDSSGNVYVSDGSNHRIQKFSPNGVFITKWGSHGSGYGEFSNMYSLALDSLGNIYVSDSARIKKISSTGEFITVWGKLGSNDGEFDTPRCMAINSSGDVYVVDTCDDQVQKFRKN